jgi:hypothetical protein
MHGLNARELRESSALAPSKEVTDRPGVGKPGVSIPDVRSEEFEEAFGRPLASPRNHGRDPVPRITSALFDSFLVVLSGW